jgi:hypothetical protein
LRSIDAHSPFAGHADEEHIDLGVDVLVDSLALEEDEKVEVETRTFGSSSKRCAQQGGSPPIGSRASIAISVHLG